jgi:hypothetical protein
MLPSSSHNSTRTIVISVIGGMLLILTVAFLYWRKRSRSRDPQLEAVTKNPATGTGRTRNAFIIVNPYTKRPEVVSTTEHRISVNPSELPAGSSTMPGAPIAETAVPVPPTDDTGSPTNEMPDRRSVAGVESARIVGENPALEEMQAIRREVLQLQQLVGRVDADGNPPPEYE